MDGFLFSNTSHPSVVNQHYLGGDWLPALHGFIDLGEAQSVQYGPACQWPSDSVERSRPCTAGVPLPPGAQPFKPLETERRGSGLLPVTSHFWKASSPDVPALSQQQQDTTGSKRLEPFHPLQFQVFSWHHPFTRERLQVNHVLHRTVSHSHRRG